MAHAARAHVTWMSAVIMVAVTASCLTWLIVSRETKGDQKTRIYAINGTSVPAMFRFLPSTAHCLFKVHNYFSKDNHLAWVKESEECTNICLDESERWITVKEQGVYLVYVQLTYSLKKDRNNSVVDLRMIVEFNYTEAKEEFSGAFDTRHLTEKETDTHLSAFLLLYMKAGNKLSISAHPMDRIKYDDVRPFSSYITIIQYADWSG